jgi:5'-nucleotidase
MSNKCAAALIYDHPKDYKPDEHSVRIAFDADAVIFSDDSEKIFKAEGLEKFQENERRNENVPLSEGPFAKFIKLLSRMQSELSAGLIRIAIVTARDYPANIRVIKTLRSWGVSVDEAFFLGGVPKDKVLKAFNAHIFFDDQDLHVKPASDVVPASRVPYKQ